MLIITLSLALLMLGCDSAPAPPPPAAASAAEVQGKALYQQVAYTYPVHTDFDLQHQLMVRSEDPATVIAILGLKPGMVVADIGCGSGFYTPRFARAVGPTGRVLALDVQIQPIKLLRERLQDGALNPYDNVTTWVSQVDTTQIDPATVDLAFIGHADFYAFDVLLPENVSFLQSCYRAVKPGGRLVVLQNMRIVPAGSVEAIRRNFRDVGFVVDRTVDDPRGTDEIVLFHKPLS